MTTAAPSTNQLTVQQILADEASRGTPHPVPRLNGYLIKKENEPPVYLVVNGYRRHVVSPKTMRDLFVHDRYVHEVIDDISFIAKGPDIAVEAMLVKGEKSDPWYFLPGGQVKMWIRSPQIHQQYQFRKVSEEEQFLIDSIPNGPDVEGR